MGALFGALSAFALIAFILGLARPSWVVRWGNRRTRGMSTLIYFPLFIVLLVIGTAVSPGALTNPPQNKTMGVDPSTPYRPNNTTANSTASDQAKNSADNGTSNTSNKTSSPSTNSTPAKTSTPAKQPASSNMCRSNPLAGVYHTYRFTMLSTCKTASGTVTWIKHEPDHDYHIRLQVDSQYTNLLSTGNTKYQYGDLVVEIIPMDQPYVPIPSVGQHITVVGAWVDDNDHGWNEIHPAWLVNGKGKLSYTAAAAQQSVITGICGNGDKDCPTSNSSSNSGSTSGSSSGSGSSTSSTGLSITASKLTVTPGDYASVTVKTKPYTQGTIEVDYSSGPSKSSSLDPKTSSGSGYITWQWKVGTRTKPGKWQVKISAAGSTITTYLNVQ